MFNNVIVAAGIRYFFGGRYKKIGGVKKMDAIIKTTTTANGAIIFFVLTNQSARAYRFNENLKKWELIHRHKK